MWLLSRFQVPITVIPTQTQQKHNKSGSNMPTSMKNSLETQKQKPSHQCFTNTLQHAIWLAEFIFNCNISDSTFIRPFKYRYKKHISNCETYLIFSGVKNIMCICQSKQQTNLQTKQSNVMYPGGCERIILVLLHVLHRLNFKFLLSILQILHQFFFFNFLNSFLSSSGRSAKKHLKRV